MASWRRVLCVPLLRPLRLGSRLSVSVHPSPQYGRSYSCRRPRLRPVPRSGCPAVRRDLAGPFGWLQVDGDRR